jgi:tetratricopeptide (TPR) repeat protein
MKSVSKFALVLALGAFSVVPLAGVQAAEKEEKAAKKDKKGKEKPAPAFQPKLSKEFAAVYNPIVSTYVKSKDSAASVAAWPNIKAAIKTEDDRFQAGVFGTQIGREAKNNAIVADGVDLVLASTSTPADQRAIYTFQKAAIAYDAKDWPNAEIWLQKAHSAGYKSTAIQGGVEMLISDAMVQQKKYPEALDWLQKSIDASKVAGAAALPANTYARAANIAIKSKQNPLISKWMKTLVRSNGSADFWHDALIQSYSSVNYDVQETLDLVRLLRRVGAMKYEQNYGMYVDAADKRRLPAEVVSVLDEGFKAGTISKTNLKFSEDYNDAKTRLTADRALLGTVERDAQNAKTGYDAMLSGDILLAYSEYAKAAAIYEAALAKGGMADRDGKDQTDRALTRLGIAKLNMGDAAGARAAFGKITSANRRELADYWLIHMDQAAAKAAAPATTPAS